MEEEECYNCSLYADLNGSYFANITSNDTFINKFYFYQVTNILIMFYFNRPRMVGIYRNKSMSVYIYFLCPFLEFKFSPHKQTVGKLSYLYIYK